MIPNPGLRRNLGHGLASTRYGFSAPLTSSLTLDRGTGTPTFTRASTATVMGYAPTANLADGQTLLTVASGEARFVGARRISANNWSNTFADGTAIPSATLLGYLSEGAATNYFLNSGAPVTQTISLPTGTFTLGNILGSGSITSSAGTATATGYGVATSSATNRIVVTVAGTVVFTKAGTVTQAQVENTAFATSYIPTTSAAVTRAADVLRYPSAGNVSLNGSAYMEIHSSITSSVWSNMFGMDFGGSAGSAANPYLSADKTRMGLGAGPSSAALGLSANSLVKVAGVWVYSATATQYNATNGVITSGTINTTNITLNANLYIGSSSNGASQPFGTIRNVRIWQTQLPNSTLQALTK